MTTNEAKLAQVKGAWKIALGVLGALGGVGVILLLLFILIKVGLVQPTVSGAMTDQQRYDLLSQARADDQKTLTTYGWMDQSKGIVRLPIDVGMQKLVQEGGLKRQPMPATGANQ